MRNVLMKEFNTIVQYAKKEKSILAVLLFGSSATGTTHLFSDTDICLVMPDASKEKRTKVILSLAGKHSDQFDIKIFEELPLMVKGDLIKESKFLYVKDEPELFEYLWKWKKIYDDFQYQYSLAYTPPLERLKKWKQRKK